MEMLAHESFLTLQAQVDALARGTNPVVYFPAGTVALPSCPPNADKLSLEWGMVGSGVYYFIPHRVTKRMIMDAVKRHTHWALLGIVQSKEDAAKGVLAVIVARDSHGREIKSVAVDASNDEIVSHQIDTLRAQFPGAMVDTEPLPRVILERIAAAAVHV